MTTPHPLPAEGGCYIRHPDGRLERVTDEVPEEPEAAPQSPPPAKPEKAQKPPVKEA